MLSLVPGIQDHEAGRTGQGTQQAGAPWAPPRPPPLLRLERFQSRGAASLATALVQSSSPSCSDSSSSFAPAAAPAAGSKRRASAPPPSFPPPPPALCQLTFPSPDPRRRAPGQLQGRPPTSGRECGGAQYPIPAPSARSGENRTMSGAGDRGKTLARWLGTGLLGLFLLPVSLSLEVSVGKTTTIYAVNGTEILLPCTFSSCFGFENLRFWWSYNSTDTFRILIDGTVKNEKSDPKVTLKDDDRITLEGSTKEKMNNISILLRSLEFSDTGKYTCHVKNPKENNLQHQATIFLQVVDKLEEVDNTVTLIILAVVGGVIGLLIFILLLKKFITFVLKKTREKKKECLVSSSGNDNTENGLPGSKAEEKPPTKV